ncbi:hypothetical protein LMH87_003402 [Akanthomyces muscarius]|uniref:DUF7702 domain-containing protein n=1 Tax=Akanthomyces muscarius TaxID=2231603 RepID=A0A9W8Q384_AKAMU|nr:hypothetical protein LMH87_003402 [Akanthomyces muscarius]KAJ4144521.1 hypothetical protein LMH87_003402 [Akanthomyces muscarius]
MPNAHTSVGIAQVVFYAPMVPIVIYLFSRNARIRPRMAWWPLITFALFRLAGGIVTILAEKKPGNTGLWIAALILLNVGVVPLIVADLGLTRLVMQDNHASKPSYDKLAKGLRLTFLAAILLLAAGGGTASVSASTSRALTLAGYVVFALELVLLTAMQAFLLTCGRLLPSSRRVLVATLAAAPPLAVRTAYGLLEVAEQADARSTWNPLTGSAVAFALMALLPEYLVLAGWVLMGLSIPPRREVGQTPLGNEELAKV